MFTGVLWDCIFYPFYFLQKKIFIFGFLSAKNKTWPKSGLTIWFYFTFCVQKSNAVNAWFYFTFQILCAGFKNAFRVKNHAKKWIIRIFLTWHDMWPVKKRANAYKKQIKLFLYFFLFSCTDWPKKTHWPKSAVNTWFYFVFQMSKSFHVIRLCLVSIWFYFTFR